MSTNYKYIYHVYKLHLPLYPRTGSGWLWHNTVVGLAVRRPAPRLPAVPVACAASAKMLNQKRATGQAECRMRIDL